MDKISIIISCFNDAEFIEKALESALAQTYSLKEVILVDDGSNNETKLVLQKLESRATKLIMQENKGASAARNKGVRAAQGEYILILDSDDYFDSSFCSKALEIFKVEEDVKLVTCYAERFRGNEIIDIIKPVSGELKDFLKYNCALGNALFRKKDFERAGGYDEMMTNGYEDWEFYIRLLKNGGRSAVIPEPLFHYRQKSISNSTRANKIKYDLLRYIYFKHQDLYILNYQCFVNHLLERLESVEKAEQKNLEKIEYKLGKNILKPMRFLKRLLKS